MKGLDLGKLRTWKTGAIVACAALLVLFAVLSYSAALGKSPTYDEPLHAVAGFVHRALGDFRINPEDPALFGYWGSLPHSARSLKINTDYVYWDRMIEDFSTNQWYFVWLTLFRTQGNDGDAFIQASRFMFVLVGVGLGALIACWSWQLAGAWAAVTATALLALDPNFIAHSALVKNDVMLSMMMAALAMALWRFGRRGTWPSLAGVTLTCAAAVNVKFSGVLCGPIIFVALLVRALLPQAWNVVGLALVARWQRLIVVPTVCLIVGFASYLAIWGCYGFRFAPTNDPKALLNTPRLLELAKINGVKASFGSDPADPALFQQRYKEYRSPILVKVVVWATESRLLPQAWLHGFLYTYVTTQVRSSYLMGEVRVTGWWYYFPCAMLFKTPTATLAAVPLAILAAVLVLWRGRPARSSLLREIDPWSILCIALPVIIYGASAMTTNLNLGLRHILPVYPFLFIAIGVAMAHFIRWDRKIGTMAPALVILGLAVETFAAYPNYIAFFNAPSGGSRGGIALLGDSNLDWGQDLKLLAEWRQNHRDRRLYLAYFGIADASFYGIDATHVPMGIGGWPFASTMEIPSPPCYFAVSATNLQSIYTGHPDVVQFYREVQKNEPVEILGGSIYIYQYPPQRMLGRP